MPTITNFGDVVTVGNAAVNGTGTSSFAGPVTFAQGVSITGAVSTSSAFYGVLAGANTAAVSALTASTNVYAPIVTTPLVNAATVQATTGFYGVLAGQNTASVTVLTASGNVNAPTVNVTSLNVSSQANVTFLNVSSTAFLSNANVATANLTSANIATGNVSVLNVASAWFANANLATGNLTTANITTGNVSVLNVASAWFTNANLATGNLTTANITTGNVSVLNVTSGWFTSANLATGNLTTANITTGNVSVLNVASAWFTNANLATGNIATANISSLNVTGDANVANVTVRSNLYASNIIMSSNLSTNTGFGNVYLTGNLVVQGNIFSLGGSVGSGSGTSQGVLYSLPSTYALGSAFATGTAGPTMNGYHLNLTSFSPEATQSVTQFGASTGMLKFTTAGLYQITCVIAADQPLVKVAVGKTTSASFPPSVTATAGYDYVYNYPMGASPSHMVTLPLSVTDTSQYYYLDVFISTVAGAPTILYPTRSTTAVGSNYGTYIQVAPFGNYLSSATGVASALLANCAGSSNLSGVYSSNAYRVTLTSANGWTVNGTSSSLAVTSNGNFQVNQAGIYEVNLCLNTTGNTPVQFQVGSLATDALVPNSTTPQYLYSYAPMYTQDPTTTIQLPLNITNVANVYFVECSFPGTVAGNVALQATSTFVSIKPIGGYISTATNPWIQQGASVYYPSGPVGIGGVNPSALTETLTVNGTTAFVGNVTVTSDASGSSYVTGKRTPAGSLDVTQYVTGSVPLTTTTNLIQNYLSNAATIRANTSTGTITQALYVPGTVNSGVNLGSGHSAALSNLATSNLFIEAWVNFSQIGSTQVIFSRQTPAATDLGLYVTNTNILTFYVVNASGTSFTASNATTIVAGTWYHVSGSYQQTGLTTGTIRVFTNGGLGGTTGSLTTAQPRRVANANVCIGNDFSGSVLFGNVADVRVMTNCIVPIATFTAQAAPFTTAPTYRTGMDTGYTSNLTLALQSQYFPGASTSPYGPVLTLPGTVGSYYSQSTTALNTPLNSGFTIEAWVNYASFASANIFSGGVCSLPAMMLKGYAAGSGNSDWFFGPLTTGQLAIDWYNGITSVTLLTAGTITTGSWNHIVAQGNTSHVNMFINGQIQSMTTQNYTGSPTGTAIAWNGTVATTQYSGLSIGQYNGNQGPNCAIAKARVLFGANTYTTSTFTPSPNLGAVPAGGTVAWSLESQYPLPTYPSIQDVTALPQQLTSYGSTPVPVGGVTSNVLGPYSTTYPQLDSIRFDGTGYIDYGNAASSVMTTNLWANAWTIEGWVYLPSTLGAGQSPGILSRSSPSGSSTLVDWTLYLGNNPANLLFAYGSGGLVYNYNASTTIPTGTWTHVAATYDGTRSNVYVNGALSNSMVATTTAMSFNPTYGTVAGGYNYGLYLTNENLADVRVSNVARYTGSTYVVPTAPFTTDSSTLLLLKSLGGQVGTTLEVQGRGLGSTSLGATRTVQSYPPAPMSSYLLDTTSNASVTYGVGKYVASASTDSSTYPVWKIFSTDGATPFISASTYNTSSPYNYTGSVTTVDTSGNAYAGEWFQVQLPVAIILSNVRGVVSGSAGPAKMWTLGSRDGLNWTLIDTRVGLSSATVNYNTSATQAYNYYRWVVGQLIGTPGFIQIYNSWFLNGTEESLCITSDSKVGVGIANPQRSLEVAGDLVVGGTISGGAGMGSFRNRIINGDMRIAQRGTSIVVPTGTKPYLIDRFNVNATYSSGSIAQYQSTLATSDTPYQAGFRYYNNVYVTSGLTQGTVTNVDPGQDIEGYNTADFNWGTSYGVPATISFWFRSKMAAGSTASVTMQVAPAGYSYASPFTVVGPGVWQYVTVTIPPPPNGASMDSTNGGGSKVVIGGFAAYANMHNPNTWELYYSGTKADTYWAGAAGNYIHFTGVQLEKGTVATPFEFRPFAQELALCQRYFYLASSANGGNYMPYGPAWAFTSTSAYMTVQHPVTMRAAPTTLSNSALLTFYTGAAAGNALSPTGLALNNPGTSASTLNFTVSAGLTAGQALVLQSNNTTTSFLGFSAEL